MLRRGAQHTPRPRHAHGAASAGARAAGDALRGHQAEMAAERTGMFIPSNGLWDEVVAGEPAGQIVPLDAPFAKPETLRFPASGLGKQRRQARRRPLLARGRHERDRRTIDGSPLWT